MPVLKRFNPSIVETLGRQADILREDNAWLEQMTADQLKRLARETMNGELLMDRDSLIALPTALQRRLVRAAIQRTTGLPKGPTFTAVRAILSRVVHGRSGSSLTLQRSLVSREYDRLRFSRNPPRAHAASQPETFELALTVPSSLSWPPTGQLIQTGLVHSGSSDLLDVAHRSRNMAMLDADCVTMKLIVRCWKPGDVFQPLGMGGRRKKLQDYFSDTKVPRKERMRVPLVVAPEGIVWVGGHRGDHRFRMTSMTKRVLTIRLIETANAQETS
jgi:tRNA(Ile)-lysidine synthase